MTKVIENEGTAQDSKTSITEQGKAFVDIFCNTLKEKLDKPVLWKAVGEFSQRMRQDWLSQVLPDVVIFVAYRYPWFRREYKGLVELGYIHKEDKHLVCDGNNGLSLIAQYFWWREWKWCNENNLPEPDMNWDIVRLAFGLEKGVRLSQRANGKVECKEYKTMRRKLDTWLKRNA